MKDLLTIVIPCKNEKNIILKTLDLLNYQTSIPDVNVIVCDISDDTITNKLLQDREQNKTDLFNLTIIPGGLPSVARNNGFKLVTTPYVLFLDADIFLLEPAILLSSIIEMRMDNLDLSTAKFRSDNGKYNYVYKTFDVIQSISKWITPFCLGGFMLVRSETFRELGGFDEEIKVAEDYHLSKQIKSTKFKRLNHVIFTPPRRFEAKGVGYMIKLMIGSFFNHRNKKWFTEDKNYWK
jgi:glycosyltransferase involved in cell wall biosynthesis